MSESAAPVLPFLSDPTLHYRDSFLSGMRELQEEGHYEDLNYDDLETNLRYYIQGWKDRRHNPRSGLVPESILWLIDDDRFVGRVSIRHHLNERLLQFGGHIGYEIRPTKRLMGYGKTILRLGLIEAKKVGITRALVTCDDTNIGSAKIIEANGGVMENIVLLAGRSVPTRRYWIDIEPS